MNQKSINNLCLQNLLKDIEYARQETLEAKKTLSKKGLTFENYNNIRKFLCSVIAYCPDKNIKLMAEAFFNESARIEIFAEFGI